MNGLRNPIKQPKDLWWIGWESNPLTPKGQDLQSCVPLQLHRMSLFFFNGAPDKTRTCTPLRARPSEDRVSTSSTTEAHTL